jgi:hypothetical protein
MTNSKPQAVIDGSHDTEAQACDAITAKTLIIHASTTAEPAQLPHGRPCCQQAVAADGGVDLLLLAKTLLLLAQALL